MFGYEPVGFVVVALLPLLGFYLGYRFGPRAPRERAPQPPQRSSEDRVLDAIDSLREEVADLADRQEFAERLLSRKSKREVTPI